MKIFTRSVSLFGWVVNGFKAMTYLRPLGTLSFALLCSLDAHAQGVIWSSPNFTSTVGGSPGGGSPGNRQIAIDHVSDSNVPTSPSLNPVTGMFFLTISTDDAGRTIFADALNSPGLTGFIAGVTDGANDYIRFSNVSPLVGWGIGNEAGILGRSSLTPDFAGYNITQIGLRITSFYDSFYAPENRYLNTLNYSLDFYGAPVPEPSTWALAALGAGALLLRRKARQRI
jgi:hypothetical protein